MREFNQPMATLPAKLGSRKITGEWILDLPTYVMDTIKIEWLDNSQLIFVLPTNSAMPKIEKINIHTKIRTLLCEGDTPKPSPDTQWIAFTKKNGEETQLCLVSNGDSKLKKLIHRFSINEELYKYNFNFFWSNDSRLIALVRPIGVLQSLIEIIDVCSGEIKEIFRTNNFQIRSAVWSLDNKEILIWQEQVEGQASDTQDQEVIQSIRLHDGYIRTLAKFNGLQQQLNPTLSPDGKSLAVMYDPNSPYFDITQNIGLISTQPINDDTARSVKQLTHGLKLLSPQWSPDGQYLYALRVYGAYKQIYRINATTGDAEPITLTSFSIDTDGYALSSNGKQLAWTALNAHNTRVIQVASNDGQEIRNLVTLSPVPDDMALSEVREVEWKTLNQHICLRGLLILPLDYQAGIRYPLIVDVHGGGLSAAITLSGAILVSSPLEWQMWSAKGFAVFVPEFHSSGVLGHHSNMHTECRQYDMINQDAIDIETGVDSLIVKGIVNSNFMFIVGHSAGARRINWLLTIMHKFRAAISKEGWADELHAASNPVPIYPYKRVCQHFEGAPQSVPENYIKHSAFFHASNITTPILFIMGNPAIGGIDFSGTIELFCDAIKRNRIETKLVYYSDEGHLFKNLANQFDALRQSQLWIEKHMQDNNYDR